MFYKRIALYAEFVNNFAYYAFHIREVILTPLVLITLGGWAISKFEDINLGDAIYFAFITALSIGYGDISPETTMGKILSVAIGLVGMLFIGLTVAIAVQALRDTAKQALRDTAKRHPATKN